MSFKTKIKLNNKQLILPIIFALTAAVFFLPQAVHAQGTNWVTTLIGGIAQGISYVLGWILAKLMAVLVYIAQYNSFIKSAAIVNGWVIARDISNMFFVIILLIIAFATILRLENYSYKKWLPKLILMAILINFSKTICGLLIDLAQVVMLTFVNAFKDVAAGGLVDMLGITNWQQLNDIQNVSAWEITGAYVLSVIYAVIAVVTVAAMVGMLVMRIIMLWVYVVLSPFAYLLAAFPGGASYSSMWWKDFTKNLIVGPVLAFFIWLSFTSLASFNSNTLNIDGTVQDSGDASNPVTCQKTEKGVCAYGTSDLMIKFIISIAMLLGGMKVAQEIGGAAAGVAGKISDKGFAFSKKWGKKIALGDNYLARKTMVAAKTDFRPIAIANAVKSSFAQKKIKDEDTIRQQGIANLTKGGVRSVLGGVGAGTDWANNYVDGFLGAKGVSRAFKETFVRPLQRKARSNEMDRLTGDMASDQEYLNNNISETDRNKANVDLMEGKRKLTNLDSQITDLKMKKISSGGLSKEDSDKLDSLERDKEATEKQNGRLEKDLGKNMVTDDEYKSAQDRLGQKEVQKNALKEEIDRVAPPQALEGLGAYRKTINESKSKYKDETNSDKLVQLFNDAVRRKDKFDQIALMEKLSNDGNLNEILNKKGYSSNAQGLYSFVNNLENNQGKKNGLAGGQFNQRDRLQILNDLGESEERVGHWEMAKTVGLNDKGQLESLIKPKNSSGKDWKEGDGKIDHWDDREHVIASASEIAKMDPQKIAITLNRLAYGGETADGKFELSNLGRVLVKMLDNAGSFVSQKQRIQANIANNLTQPQILDQLKEMNISLKTISALQDQASGKPTQIVDDVLGEIK